jgi:hypothetical protein
MGRNGLDHASVDELADGRFRESKQTAHVSKPDAALRDEPVWEARAAPQDGGYLLAI